MFFTIDLEAFVLTVGYKPCLSNFRLAQGSHFVLVVALQYINAAGIDLPGTAQARSTNKIEIRPGMCDTPDIPAYLLRIIEATEQVYARAIVLALVAPRSKKGISDKVWMRIPQYMQGDPIGQSVAISCGQEGMRSESSPTQTH